MPDNPQERLPGNPSDADSEAGRPTTGSLRPQDDGHTPRSPRRGLPTWALMLIVAVLTIIIVPALLFGALCLVCMNTKFSVGP